MKKLIFGFILVAVLGVFLFAGQLGTFKSNGNAKVNIMGDINNKIVYLTYIYDSELDNISSIKLDKAEKNIRHIICNSSEAQNYLNKGYKYVVQYIYPNDIIIRITITQCSIQ